MKKNTWKIIGLIAFGGATLAVAIAGGHRLSKRLDEKAEEKNSSSTAMRCVVETPTESTYGNLVF